MLHYEALRQLTHERCGERELEARAERLARDARVWQEAHKRRLIGVAAAEKLVTRRREAQQHARA